MNTPLRGVNLGGWLVLEPWITPSLFAGTGTVDEYGYCRQASTTTGLKNLQQHRDSFIAEQDFAWLAEQGINTVRLPVGYWLFGDVEPYMETASYVDLAFEWASSHGIKILLDLHGAPGSQNGTIHSGRKGDFAWSKVEHVAATLDVLERIGKRYGKRKALLGISLLNEPSPKISTDILEDFYAEAYVVLSGLCHDEAWIVFSHAFKPRRWRARLKSEDYPRILVDHHQYQVYRWVDKLLPARLQLWRAQYVLPFVIRGIAKHHPLIVGEWSMTMRWKKLEALRHPVRQRLTNAYGKAQLAAFSSSAAWFYWTYKTEGGGLWSFRDMVDSGTIEPLV